MTLNHERRVMTKKKASKMNGRHKDCFASLHNDLYSLYYSKIIIMNNVYTLCFTFKWLCKHCLIIIQAFGAVFSMSVISLCKFVHCACSKDLFPVGCPFGG